MPTSMTMQMALGSVRLGASFAKVRVFDPVGERQFDRAPIGTEFEGERERG